MIERLVVEVPSETGFTVGDLKIAGIPIRYGGQIAECITVKLVGAAAQLWNGQKCGSLLWIQVLYRSKQRYLTR